MLAPVGVFEPVDQRRVEDQERDHDQQEADHDRCAGDHGGGGRDRGAQACEEPDIADYEGRAGEYDPVHVSAVDGLADLGHGQHDADDVPQHAQADDHVRRAVGLEGWA